MIGSISVYELTLFSLASFFSCTLFMIHYQPQSLSIKILKSSALSNPAGCDICLLSIIAGNRHLRLMAIQSYYRHITGLHKD